MSDQPLTVTELELTAAKAEEHAAEIIAGGRLNTLYRWPEALARVCRQALAQAAEIDTLVGLTGDEVNELLERWDQTEPHIQRGIVIRFANLCRTKDAEIMRLEDALRPLLEFAEDLLPAGATVPEFVARARAALRKESTR